VFLLELARRDSRRRGIISARSMGTVFAWMRPDDLVFNYVVNNWLMGEDPPAFEPAVLGSDRHPPLEAAPGSYVLDRIPPGGQTGQTAH
jgi:poly(3-hydroxyalkanoate) synthetase